MSSDLARTMPMETCLNDEVYLPVEPSRWRQLYDFAGSSILERLNVGNVQW